MANFDIAIHGSGLVGQSLALHLARGGFRVVLVGKSSQQPMQDDVRAFALGHAAKAWLESLQAWSTGLDTTPVAAMHITGDAGGALDFKTQAKQDSLNWIVEVPALAARLSQLVANESSIQQLMQPTPQATLHVVCDRRSDFWQTQLQPQAHTHLTTTSYGQHAIAARLASDSPHGQTAKQWFNDAGEVLALLPTGGAGGSSAGESTYALVWSLASSRAQVLAKAEPVDFLEQLSAAQTDTTRADPLSLKLTSERVLWPLNLSKVDVWSGVIPQQQSTHWVLAGDAAHTVHPLAGQGLNLGFGDAALLAHRLIALRDSRSATLAFKPTSTQLQRLLRSYARERKAAAARIASVTDGLHLLYARQNTAIRGLRNLGMNAVNNLSFAKQWLIQQAQS
jgi:2-polyprenyl-6-methoxyphenol hydroxylase-like FAD-dependent oxidoreductase